MLISYWSGRAFEHTFVYGSGHAFQYRNAMWNEDSVQWNTFSGNGWEKVFQMVSKIWDKKLPKISQLHGNFVGKQTFSEEDIHFA